MDELILKSKDITNHEKRILLAGKTVKYLYFPYTKKWFDKIRNIDISRKNPCVIKFTDKKINYNTDVSRITIGRNAKHETFKGRKIKSGEFYILKLGKTRLEQEPEPEPEPEFIIKPNIAK